MTGSPSTPGFLPRALEMIFSSIEGRQTKEFQIQPDDKNGFRSAPKFVFHSHFELMIIILTLNVKFQTPQRYRNDELQTRKEK